MKKKRKKSKPSLRINDNQIDLKQKWSPKSGNLSSTISRPTDVVSRFRIGKRSVLLKLKELMPNDIVTVRTKIPEEVVDTILKNGENLDFWSVVKAKRPINPQSTEKKKEKSSSAWQVPRLKKKKDKNKKKGKNKRKSPRSIGKVILTPIGGQPGYKKKFRRK